MQSDSSLDLVKTVNLPEKLKLVSFSKKVSKSLLFLEILVLLSAVTNSSPSCLLDYKIPKKTVSAYKSESIEIQEPDVQKVSKVKKML